MANKEHLAILEEGIVSWNQWRTANPEIRPILSRTRLKGSYFRRIDFTNTDLSDADLSGADLRESDLRGVRLSNADLSQANLSESNLNDTLLVRTNLTGANFSGCRVCGFSAELVQLDDSVQNSLIVSYPDEPYVAVDGLDVATFVHRLIHDDDTGVLVNDTANRVVLLVGSFGEERRRVRVALQEKLREQGFVPLVMDYDTLENERILETMQLLASVARFIVADVTGTATLLSELREFMPSLPGVSVQPIAYASEVDPTGFEKYKSLEWMLPLHLYDHLSGWEDLSGLEPDESGNPRLILPPPVIEEELEPEELPEEDIAEEGAGEFTHTTEADMSQLEKAYEDFLDSVAVDSDETSLAEMMLAIHDPATVLPAVAFLEEESEVETVVEQDALPPVSENGTVEADTAVHELNGEHKTSELHPQPASEADDSPEQHAVADDDDDTPAAEWTDLDPFSETEWLDEQQTLAALEEEHSEAGALEPQPEPDEQQSDAAILPIKQEDDTEDDTVIAEVSELEPAGEVQLDNEESEGEDDPFPVEPPLEDAQIIRSEPQTEDDEADPDAQEDDYWERVAVAAQEEEAVQTMVTVVGERERRVPPQQPAVPLSLMLKRAAVIAGLLAVAALGYFGWQAMHRDVLVEVPAIAQANVFVNGKPAKLVSEENGNQSFEAKSIMTGELNVMVYSTQIKDLPKLEFVRYKRYQQKLSLERGSDPFLHTVKLDLLYSVRKVTRGKYPNLSADGKQIAFVQPVSEFSKKIWYKDVYVYDLQSEKRRRITSKNEFFYDWDRPYLMDNNRHAYLKAYNSGAVYPYFVHVGTDTMQLLPLESNKSRYDFLPLPNKKGIVYGNKVFSLEGKYLKTFYKDEPYNSQLYYAGENGVIFLHNEDAGRKRTLRLNSIYVDLNTLESRVLFNIFKNNPPYISASNDAERVVVSDYTGLNIDFFTIIKLWENGKYADLVGPLQDGSREYKDGTKFHKTEACTDRSGRKIVFEYDGDIYLLEIPVNVTIEELQSANLAS